MHVCLYVCLSVRLIGCSVDCTNVCMLAFAFMCKVTSARLSVCMQVCMKVGGMQVGGWVGK